MRAYVRRRLGNERRAGPLLREMFVRAFTAPTLADFWRYWNPVYGYFLSKFIYRPLHRILPASLSAVLTFAFCGFFLHDLVGQWPVTVIHEGRLKPPLAMTWFVLMGLAMVLGNVLDIRLDRVPRLGRVIFHVVVIGACFGVAYLIVSQLALKLT